jgi:hypothetical protein
MGDSLKKGDKVEWETPQGKTSGTVKKKLTAPTGIKGHHVSASKESPEFLVESEKSGKEAAHKPEALKKPQTKTK